MREPRGGYEAKPYITGSPPVPSPASGRPAGGAAAAGAKAGGGAAPEPETEPVTEAAWALCWDGTNYCT